MLDLQFGPIAPVLGAVFGALITASVTYFFVVKRKKILIALYKAEDVASEIRKLRSDLAVTFENKTVAQLNRAVGRVSNTGNSSLANINIRLSVPGHRTLFSVQGPDGDGAAIQVQEVVAVDGAQINETSAAIGIGFLNPKEKCDLIVWFDGELASLKAQCRLEDVAVKIKSINEPERTFSAKDLLSDVPKALAFAITFIVTITTGVNALYQYYSSKYIYSQQLEAALENAKQAQQAMTKLENAKNVDLYNKLEQLQKELNEQQFKFERDFLRSEKNTPKP